jgi:NAD+ synthase (glutamine-hydrolysing)
MKIALSQLNYRVGDLEINAKKIKESIARARDKGADLVVFSELSVCGYPPADLLNFDAFVSQCLMTVEDIASVCHGVAAIVGGPAFNNDPNGKHLFNAAFFLENGCIRNIVHKTLLPTYDVFDEYRYFEPSKKFDTIAFKGKKLAITICEDIWNIDRNALYPVNPMDELIKGDPDLMVNISASPFAWNRGPERLMVLSENAKKYNLPLFYVNQLGANTDLIFDGGSAVFNPSGNQCDQMALFEEDMRLYDLETVLSVEGEPVNPVISEATKNNILMRALVMGLADYFRKLGLDKAILGLSGGIDSALTLVIAVEALGKDNVWAVLLPGPYSSDHSVEDARLLAEKLGVRHDLISINEVTSTVLQTLNQYFSGMPSGIAEENIQARARALLLMGLSNKYGHVLLNTSNKSEAAVGYGTLYGDMCGGLSVIGDLYKTEVYSLSKYINRSEEIIPVNSIMKPPSAELKPDQKDTDSLPEYDILDAILYKYIEQELSPAEICGYGFDKDLVKRVLTMVNDSEYKRKQSPPVLRISQKAFGTGRRMPIVGKYFTQRC